MTCWMGQGPAFPARLAGPRCQAVSVPGVEADPLAGGEGGQRPCSWLGPCILIVFWTLLAAWALVFEAAMPGPGMPVCREAAGNREVQ